MTKARLKAPLESRLDQRAPAHAREMWQEIEEKRAGRLRGRLRLWRAGMGPRAARAMRVQPLRLGLLVTLMLLPLAWQGSHLLVPAIDPGPLTLAGGGAMPGNLAPAEQPQALDLADGSRITVAAGARLDVLASSSSQVALALRAGRARFDIRPKGPRSWRIDCGLATVEVVGTGFILNRSASGVSIEVLHGAVLVRGAEVLDGVERLTAGKKRVLGVHAPAPEARAPERSTTARAPEAAPAPPEAAAETHAPSTAKPTAALPQSASTGPRLEADLFEAADRARSEGRTEDAVALLKRIVSAAGDPARSALAAFTLARLEAGQADGRGRAALHLRQALALPLPKTLASEALTMLFELEYARGNRREACALQKDPRWNSTAASADRSQLDSAVTESSTDPRCAAF